MVPEVTIHISSLFFFFFFSVCVCLPFQAVKMNKNILFIITPHVLQFEGCICHASSVMHPSFN